MEIEPLTREEELLKAISDGSDPGIKPITREELFLAKAAGVDVETPEPITRKEMFFDLISRNQENVNKSDLNEDEYVTFVDYDGTVIYRHKIDDIENMKNLPSLPSHNGLTCQGWNWDIDSIKSIKQGVTVGAVYITNDYATKVHINLKHEERLTLSIFLNQSIENGTVIDWGDGMPVETLGGSGDVSAVHEYKTIGKYVISILPEKNCVLQFGNSGDLLHLLGDEGTANQMMINVIEEINVGGGVESLSTHCLNRCFNLEKISLPNGIKEISSDALSRCYGLKALVLPESVETLDSYCLDHVFVLQYLSIGKSGLKKIGSQALYSCHSLKKIFFPDTLESIADYCVAALYWIETLIFPGTLKQIKTYAAYTCHSLKKIEIKEGTEEIGKYAFSSCSKMESISIPDSVRILDNGAFSGDQSCYKFVFPKNLESIGGQCFSGCLSAIIFDFSMCNSIPSLSSVDAFNRVPKDFKIIVPEDLKEQWVVETNWTQYASNIVTVVEEEK